MGVGAPVLCARKQCCALVGFLVSEGRSQAHLHGEDAPAPVGGAVFSLELVCCLVHLITLLKNFFLQNRYVNVYRNPSPSEGRQTENHSHRKLTNLITWTTALSNSMKL